MCLELAYSLREFRVAYDFSNPVFKVSSIKMERQGFDAYGVDLVAEVGEVYCKLACGFSDVVVEEEGFVISDVSQDPLDVISV